MDPVPIPTPIRTLALVPIIDWTFFFTAWELRGKFPAIFNHPKYGAAARELYADGKKKLDELVKGKLIRASAVYGFWPAASEGSTFGQVVSARDPRNVQFGLKFLF